MAGMVKPMAFKMSMQNIPIINLKKEFIQYHDFICSEEFKAAVFNSAVKPLQLPSMLWSGMPNDLFTLMTHRAIGGLEAYIVAAAEYELSKVGKADANRCGLDNPFSLGSGAVKVRYDCVPGLVGEHIMLSRMDQDLYKKTEEFYKEIRNPIFHGNQLVCSYENYPVLMDVFEHMRLLYSWVNEWHSAFPSEDVRA